MKLILKNDKMTLTIKGEEEFIQKQIDRIAASFFSEGQEQNNTDIVPDAGELPSGDSSDSPNSISPHNDDNDVPVSKAPVETSAPAEADPEIAADENHHQEKENIKKPAPGIRHHNVDKGKIAALRKAGWSYDKIAEEMGLTKSAVTNIIFKMRKSGEYDI